MEKLPLVSIVIPVYNGSNYMKEAIDSALAQTYKNIEIIVVNDGSKDNGETERIAKSYGNKIRYFSKENGGVSTALNFGIKQMKGDYFSWLSHDDLYWPEKIEIQINYLIDKGLIGKKVITYTNYDVVNEKTEKINRVHFEIYCPNENPEYALLRGLVSGITIMIPKFAFEEHGLFDEKYRCIQDYLLFYKFIKTYKYIFIPQVTSAIRIHEKQVTNNNPKIICENNFLWTKMQKELPLETKIKLDGSEYWFYIKMYQFLINHNNYTEAQRFSLQQANKFLKKECFKIKKLMDKLNPIELFSLVCSSYEMIFNQNKYFFKRKYHCHKMPLVDDKYKMIFNKIVHNIGLENTIQFILDNKNYVKDENILEKYRKINKYIININSDSFFDFKKSKGIMKFFKKQRLFKVFKILKNKIFNNYEKK